MHHTLLTAFLISLIAIRLQAQKINPIILQKSWQASWISVPGEPPTGYGVYLFRKSVELPIRPTSFVVHVSADNRYKLYVNEILVSLGPARGNLTHWKFESVDLAPYLQSGKNIIAARVWNEGDLRMEAQISLRTGFILQGSTESEYILNTNSSWHCLRDSSYSPLSVRIPGYYVAGPGELVASKVSLKGWETSNYSDTAWKGARPIFLGSPKNVLSSTGSPNGWMMVPSLIPPMEMTIQRLAQVRKADGITVPTSFPATKTALTIPANTVATLLLDQAVLTNAFPTLLFSGEKMGVFR